MRRLTDEVLSHLDGVLAEATTQSELERLETVTFAVDGPLVRVADRFEIGSTIGRGGMGEVYRAKDLQTGRDVALKVQHVGEAWLDARFEREVTALADLDHPCLVRYVAHGTSLEGVLWVATELLTGETLAELLLRGALPAGAALVIARDVVSALGAIHALGFVHRDVKPANVFVEASGRAKLLDLGLLGDTKIGGAALTESGALLGTVGYLSPEQARGLSKIEATADFFALGCVLFECLAGTLPFGRSLAEITAAFAMGGRAPLAKLPAAVTPRLRELIRELLEIDAAKRPASAMAVEQRLTVLLGERLGPAVDRSRGDATMSDEPTSDTLTLQGGAPAGPTLPFIRLPARPPAMAPVPLAHPEVAAFLPQPGAGRAPPARAPPAPAPPQPAPPQPAPPQHLVLGQGRALPSPHLTNPKQDIGRPDVRIDLLWYDAAMAGAIRAAGLGGERRALDDERGAITRVLSRGQVSSWDDLSSLYAAPAEPGTSAPLALADGWLELDFEPLDKLRATLAAVTPLLAADRQLKEIYDAGLAALRTTGRLSAGAATVHVERVELRLHQLARSTTTAVEASVDRALIESKSFARSQVFGGSIRALLTTRGAREGAPAFLGEEAARELPLMRAFPVRAVVELRPPQDVAGHPFALRVLALARVVGRLRMG